MMLLAKALLVCCFTILAELSVIEAFQNNEFINDLLEERRHYEAAQKSIAEWRSALARNRKKRADKVVCYGELGCFEETAYLEMLPSPPEEIDTKFFVYSAKHRSEKPILEFFYDEIAKTNNGTTPPPPTPAPTQSTTSKATNGTTPVKHRYAPQKIFEKFGSLENVTARAIIHGFGSSCTHVWVYEMRTALMAVEDCIVICMDWENGATLPNYVRAAANTRLVGRQLAYLLKGLEEHNKLNMSRVHLIGFSLGSHVAGFAGMELKGLQRITGLDPAGPLFEAQHPHARLDDTDAGFVDVIHSNGENLILGGLGSWQPMGAVDFYPNGGRVQHGCSNLFVGAVTDIIWAPPASVEGRSLCNHRRAYKFFIDSVAPKCLFPAFPCDSYENFLKGECFSCSRSENGTESSVCGNMGYYADRSIGRGQLYLKTREEEPFCAHQYKLEIQSSPNELPLRTLGRLEVELESDGGLTEVFTITEKDDAELFAGEMISQILVPHPALGFPKNITLTYTTYKGWLTRGLSSWSINKVVLSDGFGKSFSLCKQMHLDSNSPLHMTLLPGECEDEDDYIHQQTDEDHSTDSPEESDEGDDYDDSSKGQSNERNDVNPHAYASHGFRGKGPHIDYDKNIDNQPWQPIVIDLPRSYRNTDTNSSYPVYITPSTTNPPTTTREEISEPILKRVQHEPRKLQNKSNDRTNDKRSIETPPSKDSTATAPPPPPPPTTDNKLITVQLFPYRFANVFEKAERYARLTLLPLLTEQFPQFFRTTKPDDEETPLENVEFNETEPIPSPTMYKTNRTNKSAVVDRRSDSHVTTVSESHGEQRNFNSGDKLDILPPSTRKAYISEDALFDMHRIEESSTRVEDASRRNDDVDDQEETIRIDLPTFRPPKSRMIPLDQQQSRFIPLNYKDSNQEQTTSSISNVMGDIKPNDSKS
ncbi:uncharacterized protein LOC5564068 [Aedes aegypti]|uniref:Lipase domain-containing protein n=1 Tax=Aedes aegypti TaxID=7159 RepID=A0A6I8U6A7_AEDAE|nr:uncharacterized protein LOC5564068 [Aedes aegypti]XP_021704097.1 uncharacterized protein LOC5564068 [Aedes aegypti]